MHPDLFKDNLRNVEITKVNKRAPKCPNCGRKMTLTWYEKGSPTENEVFGCKLSDWNHPMLSYNWFAPEGCFFVQLLRFIHENVSIEGIKGFHILGFLRHNIRSCVIIRTGSGTKFTSYSRRKKWASTHWAGMTLILDAHYGLGSLTWISWRPFLFHAKQLDMYIYIKKTIWN